MMGLADAFVRIPDWGAFVVVVIVVTVTIAASAAFLAPGPRSTVNQGGPSPYSNPIYLLASPGCGVGGSFGAIGGPCFGGNLSSAYVFNCASAAATSSGCTTTVAIPSNPSRDYSLTIWYPRFNDSLPETNCEFKPSLGYPLPLAGWCTAVNPNGFVISEQNPGAT